MLQSVKAGMLLFITLLFTPAAFSTGYGKIELIRDTWGVPHVFAETDAGAMYGLGCGCRGSGVSDDLFPAHHSGTYCRGAG